MLIVVGIDRSDQAARSLDFAIELAKTHDAQLVLCHVIPWSPFSFTTQIDNEHREVTKQNELRAASEQVLAPAVAVVEAAGLSCETYLVHGDAAKEVTRLAAEADSAQIVVGKTGEARMTALVFGSTTSKIVQLANCPVTVIP